MSEMIKRVAQAVYPLTNVDWDDAYTIARVSLLTALDSDDEALVDRIAMNLYSYDAMTTTDNAAVVALQWPVRIYPTPSMGAATLDIDKTHYRKLARAAILALKVCAQGGSEP